MGDGRWEVYAKHRWIHTYTMRVYISSNINSGPDGPECGIGGFADRKQRNTAYGHWFNGSSDLLTHMPFHPPSTSNSSGAHAHAHLPHYTQVNCLLYAASTIPLFLMGVISYLEHFYLI